MKLGLGILARERPEATAQAITTALTNAAEPENLNLYVMFDEDYKCAYKVKERLSSTLSVSFPIHFLVSEIRLYYVKAANTCLEHIKEDLFVLSNNDVNFLRDWDIKAKAIYAKAPGVIELGTHQDLKCANFVSSKSFLRELQGGYVSYPEYTHYCCDTELMYRAMERGAYHWLAPGVIWHNEIDDDMKKHSIASFWGSDQRLWARRKKILGWEEFRPKAKDFRITL